MALEDAIAALEDRIRRMAVEVAALTHAVTVRDRIIHEYADHVGPDGIKVPITEVELERIRAWLRARWPETMVETLQAIAELAPRSEESASARLDNHLRSAGLARELLTSLGITPKKGA